MSHNITSSSSAALINDASHTAAAGTSPAELLAFARTAAADTALLSRVPLDPHERTWQRYDGPGGSEMWLLGWPPHAETGWHDHAGSHGAFATATGELVEDSIGVPLPTKGWRSLELDDGVDHARRVPVGDGRAFGAHHVHRVANPSAERHAISVHVYYPPLPSVRRYSRSGRVLRLELVEGPDEW